MSFVHVYMLGGLALLSVPIIVHLAMRQKPKQRIFPAFRFLKARLRTNQRKLRLHHLLLLLLRMLLVAALCLALAASGEKLPPATVVLVFDTSTSMGYERSVDGEQRLSRLEEAKQRALELLDSLPQDSRIAIADSADGSVNFALTRAKAQAQVRALTIRHNNSPVSDQLRRATGVLNDLRKQEVDNGLKPSPQYLYVFSDRTTPSWGAEAQRFKTAEEIRARYVDLGTDHPIDYAIDDVEINDNVVLPSETARIKARVRLNEATADADLRFAVGRDWIIEKNHLIRPRDGRQQTVAYSIAGVPGGDGAQRAVTYDPKQDVVLLSPGIHQLTFQLAATDPLRINNQRFWTVEVLRGQKVLLIVDDYFKVADSEPPFAAIRDYGRRLDSLLYFHQVLTVLGFDATIVHASQASIPGQVNFNDFEVVWLYQVRDPSLRLWNALTNYVATGHNLVVVPPRMGKTYRAPYGLPGYFDLPFDGIESYRSRAARLLLPGILGSEIFPEEPVFWDWESADDRHVILERLVKWSRQPDISFATPERKPRMHRYWTMAEVFGAAPIRAASPRQLSGRDAQLGDPILLERLVGNGIVVQLNSVLDGIPDVPPKGDARSMRSRHNYWSSSFGLILTDKICRYLAGSRALRSYNYTCGSTIHVPLDQAQKFDYFEARGPGYSPAKGLSRPEPGEKPELVLTNVREPGNYEVVGYYLDKDKTKQEKVIARFSVNLDDKEGSLQRLPAKAVTDVMGEDAILDPSRVDSLQEDFAKLDEPFDPVPWLMLLLLVGLAMENLLANRRPKVKPDDELAAPAASFTFTLRPLVVVLASTGVGVALGIGMGYLRFRGYDDLALHAGLTGLLGLAHGLVVTSRFEKRDAAIFGGILGSMIGVVHGGLLLSPMLGLKTSAGIFLGMILGAALLALDGWFAERGLTWKEKRL